MKFLYRPLLAVVLVLFAVGAQAQSLTTAAMNGQVASSTGESLVGATVRAVHVPSGSLYGAVVNASGRFYLPGLRIGGPYTVTVEYVGYQKYTAENIQLSLGGDKQLNIVMKEEGVTLGAVEIVSSKDQLINSGRTGANTVINAQQLQTMPTFNRDLNSFLRFTPQSNGGGGFGGRQGSSNNFTLDGALLNNNFGLSGSTLPGQGSGAQPVSLDALEEVSANIAPYDVRQFGFTGAGVSLVTRAGTNDYEGSIAWFGQRGNWSRNRVAGQRITLNFSERDQFVARVGGPIIKDKLFFHLTFERTSREIVGTTRNAREAGETPGLTIANVSADSLRLVRDAVRNAYGYDVGSFGVTPLIRKATNITARLDWNINSNHNLSFRYNLLNSVDDISPNGSNNLVGTAAPDIQSSFSSSRSGGASSVPFSSAFYEFIENNNTVSIELNSKLFGGRASNQLLVTGSFLWSPQRSKAGEAGFPMVEIFNTQASGQNATVFGSELFRQENSIQQNQYLIQNNFSIYLGKHSVTIGGQFERYFFNNRFLASRWGTWRFRSFDAFIRNIQTPAGSPISSSAAPSQVAIQYDFEGRNSDAFVDAYRVGFYVQDKWMPYEGFTLTGGVRIDVPGHLTTPLRSAAAETIGIRTDALPDAYVAISPRLGLNWDVFKDGKLQVRGGTGIFTGNIPFVWMTNPVRETGTNAGATVVTTNTNATSGFPGGIGGTGAAASAYNITGFQGTGVPIDNFQRFSPVVPGRQLYPSGRTAANPGPGALQIAIVDKDFRYPSVWRSSFGVDYSLNQDWVVSLDYAYTQDLDAVFFQNTALREDGVRAPLGGPGSGAGTVLYYGTVAGVGGTTARTNPTINAAGFNSIIRFTNSNDGWAGFLTLKVEKRMSDHYSLFAAYTYTDSWAVTDGSGSQAASTWNSNNVAASLGSNSGFLQPSSALTPHRFIVGASYEWEQSKYTSTTFSFFYQLQSGSRTSFRYNGDINNDGSSANDLIFVPAVQGDITLQSTAENTATPAVQWAQLNAFISQDPYLASRRGQYAERNGGKFPVVGQLDFGIRQRVKWEVAGRPNYIEISCDIQNFGNFLNEEWGVQKSLVQNAGQFLTFNGFTGPNGAAAFTFRQGPNNIPLSRTFENNPNNFFSRFSINFGVRYVWGR